VTHAPSVQVKPTTPAKHDVSLPAKRVEIASLGKPRMNIDLVVQRFNIAAPSRF